MLDLDGISGLSDDDPIGPMVTKNKKPAQKKKVEDDDDGWGALGLDDAPAPKVSTQK